MSQIKFFALGGLGENGKNLYCVEIDKKIIVLDAGLKHPSGDLLGVDAVIPDISYLESRKEDIVGVFISHAHDKNIGALPMIISALNPPIYGTNFAIAVLKDLLKENKMEPDLNQLHIVDIAKPILFPTFKIIYYSTTHSVPESAGIGILTSDGVIVYATDFTFDQNVGNFYSTEFDKLVHFQQLGVLALLCESSGALSIGHSTSDYNLIYAIRNTFTKAEGRIIVAMYSTEIAHIQRIINEALKLNKRISIIGRRAQRLVDIGETMGYIQIPADKLVNLKYIDESNNNEFDDVVFLVTGERHEPFFMLQRMCKGYDRLLKLNYKDTVLMMCPPVVGTEKIAAKTYDALFRLEARVVKFDKKILPPYHASMEDLKLMYSLVKPKYLIPINGEYRNQLAQHDLAIDYGFSEDHVVLIDNGEVVTFENGELAMKHDTVMNGSIMVDGNFDSDINDTVLKERELLSEDGFLLIIANIDARERVMFNQPEIVSRGFMYMRDNEEVINKIEEIYSNITKKQFANRYIDWRIYKDSIRDEVQRYLYKETKRKPVVIPVIIDTQSDKICKVI
ncbi:MAG: ribonuclease J [Candidatus Izemoplasmatales bacterium]|nr:ribonuclease J [Candidatus Izemoplasmatales bacterium]MDD3864832.1 ribonuclease J [Candidatus Izemoplasmatales bacterium]